MRLKLYPDLKHSKVQLYHLVDYGAFKRDFSPVFEETELHKLEKFYAVRSIIGGGVTEAYVDSHVVDEGGEIGPLSVDVCGRSDDELTLVFCETEAPDEKLLSALEIVADSENSKAVLIYPSKISVEDVFERFGVSLESGKFTIDTVAWKNPTYERTFREALELMDLLCNQTRVKMLLPLLEGPQTKRDYRLQINPKLVYSNVDQLRTRKLIEEAASDQYRLTTRGGRILCEYLAFVEKVRKLLDEES